MTRLIDALLSLHEAKALVSVCRVMDIEPKDLLVRSRARLVARRRWIAMWLLRQNGMPWPKLSFPMIGMLLGGMDHSTVIHGVCRVNESWELIDVACVLQDRALAQAESHLSDAPLGKRQSWRRNIMAKWRDHRVRWCSRG